MIDGLECALWDDVYYGYQETCEDCSNGDAYLPNTYGDMVLYNCPRPDLKPQEPEPEEEPVEILEVIGITAGVAGIAGAVIAGLAAGLLAFGGGGALVWFLIDDSNKDDEENTEETAE